MDALDVLAVDVHDAIGLRDRDGTWKACDQPYGVAFCDGAGAKNSQVVAGTGLRLHEPGQSAVTPACRDRGTRATRLRDLDCQIVQFEDVTQINHLVRKAFQREVFEKCALRQVESVGCPLRHELEWVAAHRLVWSAMNLQVALRVAVKAVFCGYYAVRAWCFGRAGADFTAAPLLRHYRAGADSAHSADELWELVSWSLVSWLLQTWLFLAWLGLLGFRAHVLSLSHD